MRGQALDDRLAFSGFKIDSDGPLAAVARVKISSRQIAAISRGNKGRAPSARIIPRAGAFDFDNIRAEISECLSDPRTRKNAREFENAKTGKGFLCWHDLEKRLQTRNRATQDQSMHIMRAFIGVHALQIL